MKKKNRYKLGDILVISFILLIAGIFICALISIPIMNYKQGKFCGEKENIPYSFWNNNDVDGNMFNQTIINCCHSETKNNNGYYKEKICKAYNYTNVLT